MELEPSNVEFWASRSLFGASYARPRARCNDCEESCDGGGAAHVTVFDAAFSEHGGQELITVADLGP